MIEPRPDLIWVTTELSSPCASGEAPHEGPYSFSWPAALPRAWPMSRTRLAGHQWPFQLCGCRWGFLTPGKNWNLMMQLAGVWATSPTGSENMAFRVPFHAFTVTGVSFTSRSPLQILGTQKSCHMSAENPPFSS